jgi:ribonuclease HI
MLAKIKRFMRDLWLDKPALVTTETLTHYNVFTDGSFIEVQRRGRSREKFGGYCAIVLDENLAIGKILCGGMIDPSNSGDPEILAIVKVLQHFKERTAFTIYTDCMYVVTFFEKIQNNDFYANWKQMRTDSYKSSLKYLKLLDKLRELHNIEFAFIKSHSGANLNETCDYLAKNFAYKQSSQPNKELETVDSYERKN